MEKQVRSIRMCTFAPQVASRNGVGFNSDRFYSRNLEWDQERKRVADQSQLQQRTMLSQRKASPNTSKVQNRLVPGTIVERAIEYLPHNGLSPSP